jgi:hypothetical protein
MKKNQDQELAYEVVDEAFRQASANVVRTAQATGTPIIVAVKGKVKKMHYQKFEYLLAPKPESAKGKSK